MKRPTAATRRSPIRRDAPLRPWRPESVGAAFDAWVRREVKARAMGVCEGPRCQEAGTDCAHVFRLQAGFSRYDWRDWRNWPAARRLLDRSCHRSLDETRTWCFAPRELARIERAAKAEMAAGIEQWEKKAAA